MEISLEQLITLYVTFKKVDNPGPKIILVINKLEEIIHDCLSSLTPTLKQ